MFTLQRIPGPYHVEWRSKWIKMIQQHQDISDTGKGVLCQFHFSSDAFTPGKKIKPGAIPTLFPEMFET